MKDLISNYLEPISYFVLTFFLGLYLRSHQSIKIWVLFCFFLFASIIMSVASFNVGSQIPNNPKYDLLLLIMAFALGYYFFVTFFSRKKKFFVILIVAFIFFRFIERDLIFHTNYFFDSLGFGVFSLSIAIMTFLFFNQILKNVSSNSILINIDFWINAGFLIYYLPSSIIHLSIYTLTIVYGKFSADQNYIWGVQNVTLFLSAVCVSKGVLWINYRKK